uniref:Variable lymphocyte receptor A cassette n=1 Tax=Angiostrongylus cantonensis TaxID=6313 RepID=A0A0K0CZ14_ANGCA
MLVALLLLPAVTSLCSDTATCINRIRDVVAAPRK